MSRSIQVHLPSTLIGAAVLGLVLLASSAFQSPTPLLGPTVGRVQAALPMTVAGSVHVEGIPEGRKMVKIVQGTPYVVPQGRVFILTALGDGQTAGSSSFIVNGEQEITLISAAYNLGGPSNSGYGFGFMSVSAVPPGLTAPAGSTVEVAGASSQGRAWGYLADQ